MEYRKTTVSTYVTRVNMLNELNFKVNNVPTQIPMNMELDQSDSKVHYKK